MALNTIEELVTDIRQGKMVILMDDEDRENEGDLVMAATMVRPEDINFMATHGRGLICLTLSEDRCRQLSLPLRRPRVLPPVSLRLTAPGQCRWRCPVMPGPRILCSRGTSFPSKPSRVAY